MMKQVDLEVLVSVCGGSNDRKITCETLADDDVPPQSQTESSKSNPPDYAPGSFWLSKDAEFDWFDRNAFYERKGSTKGNNSNSNNNNNSNNSSQRFSMNLKKSKASIIGLPKGQKSCFADAKHRRNHPNTTNRLFLKRHEPAGKSLMNEPSSPKVSCIGRVRSKRDRNRRLRNRKVSSGSDSVNSKPEGKKTKKKNRKIIPSGSDEIKPEIRGKKGKGLWKNLRAMFRSGKGREKIKGFQVDKTSTFSKSSSKSGTCKARDDLDLVHEQPVVPGLGGMTRFVSGRRSDSWIGDVDWQLESSNKSEPLDNKEPVWRRRDVDPPMNVLCSRDWESVGPASV